MGIHGVCPDCGCVRPVAEFLADARARQALDAALRIDPRLADALLDYMGLFAPPGRKLQTRKLIRLLTELNEMVSSAEVTVNRVSYSAPVAYWRQGMEEMVARRDGLTLPLASHGYLEKVVFGIASKAVGSAERKAEEEKGYRYGREGSGELTQVAEVAAPPKKKRSTPPPGWKDEAFKRGGSRGDA